jgi:hypothetical protein
MMLQFNITGRQYLNESQISRVSECEQNSVGSELYLMAGPREHANVPSVSKKRIIYWQDE